MYKQLAISFFFLVVIAFTFFMAYRMWKPKEKRFTRKNAFLHLAFFWYLCAVAAMTIVPIRTSWTEHLLHHFNFVPVIESYHRYFYVMESKDVDAIRNYFGNLFGNILLFIPFGIFLSCIYKKRFWKVVMIGALSSVLIEFIQYLNMHLGYYRYVDIDDVILNTSGAAIGYLLYKLFLRNVRNSWI